MYLSQYLLHLIGEEALDAGANYVGLDNLIKDVKANKITFDVAIATPSVMPKIAVLGKELGRRV